MTQADMPQIRQLACNGAFSYTGHAFTQMLDRDITYDDIEAILVSATNQLIECQSPSNTPGKEHRDERLLFYDPFYSKEIILICIILFQPMPEIRVITAEMVDHTKWEKNEGSVPCLIRK